MRDDLFEKMPINELKELLASVDRQISGKLVEERSALRDQLREMAEEAGFSLAEVLGSGSGRKGKPARAKFVNPDNPAETWSGRGRQPRWMVAKLKSGGKREDYAV